MAIKTQDGIQTKRLMGRPGDRGVTYGFNRPRALYTATGGETTINLALLNPALSYNPGRAQISVKRSSGGGDLISSVDFFETSPTVITFPSGDPLLAGEVVEVTLEAVSLGIMATSPSPQCYTATATAGQTVVTCDFSWPYNLNPGKAIGGCAVYLNGAIQTRGVDFTEISLGTANTNTLTFVDPLTGGENIIVLPAYQAIDVSAAQSSFNGQALLGLQSMVGAGTQGFIDQSSDLRDVANTAIVGRAKVPNLAADLRASFGVERVMTQSIVQLQNEFGSSGEPVFSALNDDRGLIRFVGGWSPSLSDARGVYLAHYINTSDSYIEIVFYGTGLNLLHNMRGNEDITYNLDGGGESGDLFTVSTSSVLDQRNYSTNMVSTIVSGQILTTHTLKITFKSTGTQNYDIYGFEILNANASGLLNINPGTGYLNGVKYINSTVDSISYKASTYTFTVTSANATVGATYTNNGQTFTVLATIAAGTQLVCSGTGAPLASGTLTKALGTGDTTITFSAFATGMARGGRIVHYLNADGTVGQAYAAVNAAQANLSSTDHTNEEVARVYHWREFGAGRGANVANQFTGDDFSSLVLLSDRAFTLDDGTTTLVGYQVYLQTGETLAPNAPNSFITFTFVGSGVDFVITPQFTNVTSTYDVLVDGTAIATGVTGASLATSKKACKIASGLAYGTHTVKIKYNTTVSGQLWFNQFIVYQPKKPTLPSTALELCDYNMMADYVANTTAGATTIGTGLLRKIATREMVYVEGVTGTVIWTAGVGALNQVGGWEVYSDKSGTVVQYTFFGTGVELRGDASVSYSSNITVQVDNLAATTANFPLLTSGNYGGYSFSAGVLNISVSSTAASGMWLKGLPLGVHTVKFTQTQSTKYISVGAIDIITPIHSTKSNLYADLQNTLPVGSNSLMDSRKTSMIKEILPGVKAWAQAVGVYSAPTISSGSVGTGYMPVPDLSCTVRTSGGALEINYVVNTWSNAAAGTASYFKIFVDGVAASLDRTFICQVTNLQLVIADRCIIAVAPGVHQVEVLASTETGIIGIAKRIMTVKEL